MCDDCLMSISIPRTPTPPSVRTPFRVLAGIIGIMGVTAVVGTSFMIWRGTRVLTIGDVLMLPGMTWFIRLAFHAAVKSRVPSNENWPFASQGVWNFYVLLILAHWILS